MDAVSSAASVIAIIELSAKVANELLEYSSAVKNARPKIQRLLEELKCLESMLEGARKLLNGPYSSKIETSQSLRAGLEGCSSQLKGLDKRLSETLAGRPTNSTARAMSRFGIRALKWPFESKEVDGIISAFEQYRDNLSAALQIDQTAQILHMAQEFVLAKLPNAKDAAFDSYGDEFNTTCHPKTRVSLREEVSRWIEDPEGRSIFWLNGMAGTGKSTIARTIADSSFTEHKHFGASFFFKRGELDRGNASHLFSTIASQLAAKDSNFAVGVQAAIEEDPTVIGKNPRRQFDQLVLRPLGGMKNGSNAKRTLVLVLDALDECERDEDVRLIISLMSQVKALSNISPKVFLTSRPEIPIRLGFNAINGKYKNLRLQEISAPVIRNDISTFLQTELTRIKDDYNSCPAGEQLPSDWPGLETIRDLSEMAVPLFIFAATACRFVGDHAWSDPAGQLAKMLSYRSENSEIDKLDATYHPVLNQLVVESEAAQRAILKEFRIVVGSIILLAEPLSASSLSSLLGISKSMVDRRIMSLHSVFSVPLSDDGSPIRMLHLSFRDFLTNPEKSDINLFWIDEKVGHKRIASSCLKLLFSNLKENICDLKLPAAGRTGLTPSVINSHLPPYIRYACLYWVHHLIESGDDLTEAHEAYEFLQQHFLHWLEALSLLGEITPSISMIQILKNHATTSGSTSIAAFLQDATRFVLSFRAILESFPLQLYSSALIFSPKKSLVRETYRESIWKGISQFPDLDPEWDNCLQTLEGHTARVSDVLFSRDRQTLVTSSRGDNTVRVWDLKTGAQRNKHHFPNSWGTCDNIALSPYGEKVATFDVFDKKFRIFDVVTGEEILSHMWYNINCFVRFSRDGNAVLVLAFESPEAMFFNLKTGHGSKFELSTTDEEFTNRSALSPNKRSFACAVKDEIVFWDSGTGRKLHNFKAHDDTIAELAYSPDGTKMATADYKDIIRIWDVSSVEGILILETGSEKLGWKLSNLFPRGCQGLTFLPDGGQIALARQNSIYVLDLETGDELRVFSARCAGIASFAFQPDGETLATTMLFEGFSDHTVKIWDVGLPEFNQSLGKTSSLAPIMFMTFPRGLDTLFAISEHEDGNLLEKHQLSKSGVSKVTQFIPSDGEEPKKLSPDGKFIAMRSQDLRYILLWDTETGQLRKINQEPLGDGSLIATFQFSPNNKLMVIGSTDGKLRVLDILTGKETNMLKNSIGALDPPRAEIVFCPESKILGFTDGKFSVNLWCLETGQEICVTPAAVLVSSGLAVSTGGKRLAGAAYNRDALHIWDPIYVNDAQYRPETIPLRSGYSWAYSPSFTPDGRYLKTNFGWLDLFPDSPEALSESDHAHTIPFLLDGDWLYRGSMRLLWIPPDYRSGLLAWHENTVVLRSIKSGREAFIRFASS